MSARRRRRRFAGAAAAACLGLATAAAGETSRISAEAATAYQLLEIRDPEAVPADFTGGGPAHYCATPLAVAAVEALEGADPFAGRLLARALQPPSLAHHAVSPSGHFRFHYDTEGPDAVGAADADGNGVPDYVDLAMTLADSAWHVQVEVLGYQEPPEDGGFGGGDEIDIFLTDVGRSRRYGLTYPLSGGDSGPSYLEIDNDFENPVFGTADGVCPGYSGSRGHDALRVTLAHEFFHAVQFGYYQGYDGAWWQEASATWMEDVLHPGVNDYLQYVCIFLESPKSALDSGDPRVDLHAYGSSIFAFFLDQRYGRETIRFTWEEHARRRAVSLDNFDRALRDFHGEAGVSGPEAGLDRAFSDFAVWSWFVGDRHRDEFFTEGDRYPSREEPAFPVSAGAAAADSGAIDHMASRYVRLDPRLLPGGATLRIDQPGGPLAQPPPPGLARQPRGTGPAGGRQGDRAGMGRLGRGRPRPQQRRPHRHRLRLRRGGGVRPGTGGRGRTAGGGQPRPRVAEPLPARRAWRRADPLRPAPPQRRREPDPVRRRRPAGAPVRPGGALGPPPPGELGRHQRVRRARGFGDLLRGAGGRGGVPAAAAGRGARPLRRQAVGWSCSRR